jgi:4-hydroxy-tetrahydrodipicolinate synthase
MRFEGVYPAIATPFTATGDLDPDGVARLVDFVIANGVTGIVACGTTGEYYALSEAERIEMLRLVRDATAGRVRLVAGCNAGSTKQAVAYAEAAVGLGYDAVMLPAPYTSLPDQTELAEHFRVVAEAVAVPIVLYNFPARAGVDVGLRVLDALADQANIVGVKEASGDMGRVYDLGLRYGERYQVMCGSDDQALDYAVWGSQTWIAGAATFAPRQHIELWQLATRGDVDQARVVMQRLLPLIRNMETGKYNQKTKFGAALAGVPIGDVRRPLLPLTADEQEAFRVVYELAVAEPARA